MAGIDFVAPPHEGRIFRTTRRVRLGDVTPTGRVRFDAAARYLQDVARDDSADSGLENPMNWVVRRTAIAVHGWPVFQESLALATWCSGIGSRWAERRTTITGEHGGLVESATLWVHIDVETGRPARLGAGFGERYALAAAGRAADAKLSLPARWPVDAITRPWPLRRADYDILGHVNNAAYWAALEELVDPVGPALPVTAVVEHRDAIAPGAAAQLVHVADASGVAWWLTTGNVAAAAGWCRAREG